MVKTKVESLVFDFLSWQSINITIY